MKNKLKKQKAKKVKQHWCDISKPVTFNDKFGEIKHGGYGYEL